MRHFLLGSRSGYGAGQNFGQILSHPLVSTFESNFGQERIKVLRLRRNYIQRGSLSQTGIKMTDLSEIIWLKICDSLIREDAMEMHWLIKSGHMTDEELWNIEPFPAELNKNGSWDGDGNGKKSGTSFGAGGSLNARGGAGGKRSQTGNGSSGGSSLLGAQMAQCPICLHFVSGSRFAPHLERCIMGRKRAGRSHYSSLDDGIHSKKPKIPFVDPYPNSNIVRIKVRRDNGIPLAITQRREGVSKEELDQTIEGCKSDS